ncbi:sugar ABC transporter permease [Kribbella qitaiheensis]|uniref:Sugar ABC transporter permease n=1 Tax=Kribbella qitaiheensis TaxID=1544730 RepID=A0A7G6WSF3_9ACTN|nr:ABC transporter permease subunit [Kribbella qitaiheensis]QNE16918.1 sugar ABC transporter permease [Kribbella qitaiheensis]
MTTVDEVRAPVEQKPAPAPPRRAGRPNWRLRLRRDWPLLLMVTPVIVLLLVFHYLPTLGNVIAFQDYSPYVGIRDSEFIGLTNFSRLFSEAAFWKALLNTLTITAFQLVFFFPIPILLALLLNSVLSVRVRTFIQGVVYLPHFFSWVLVVSLFQQMIGGAGLLAQSLRGHGFQAVDLMTKPDSFILLVTSQAVWKDAGWGMIVFLAALSTINPALYEAAAADGANRWRRLWHITLPGLRPVIVLLLILRLGDSLTVGFEQFILQRNAVGADAAEVLDTYVYFEGLLAGDFGYGAAAGLFKGVVGLVLVLVANKFAHLVGEQGVYSRS